MCIEDATWLVYHAGIRRVTELTLTVTGVSTAMNAAVSSKLKYQCSAVVSCGMSRPQGLGSSLRKRCKRAQKSLCYASSLRSLTGRGVVSTSDGLHPRCRMNSWCSMIPLSAILANPWLTLPRRRGRESLAHWLHKPSCHRRGKRFGPCRRARLQRPHSLGAARWTHHILLDLIPADPFLYYCQYRPVLCALS